MNVQKAEAYWDFFLATGFHMMVLCVYSILKLRRSDVLKCKSTGSTIILVLQSDVVPNSDSSAAITEACRLLEIVSDEFYDLMVRHLHDVTLCKSLCASPIIS